MRETGENFRSLLRNEYAARNLRNTRYSLRAFSKDLGLPATRLSDVLNSRQGLSVEVAKKITKKLGWPDVEAEYFCTLVQKEHARSHSGRLAAQTKLESSLKRYLKFDRAKFQLLSDWHHFAILELVQLRSFQNRFKWISNQLGISEQKVGESLRLLESNKLLRRVKDGWRRTKEHVVVPSGGRAAFIRKYHRQVLEKATDALFQYSTEERSFSAVNLSISEEDYAWVLGEIEKFKSRLIKRLENSKKERLYNLSIQFFPLNKGGTK